MEKKICSKCKEEKEVCEFNKKLITKSVTYDLFKSITLNENGYVDNFCGFKLLQYEDCIISQFGKPTSRKSLKNNPYQILWMRQITKMKERHPQIWITEIPCRY
jgi:hypothetical protein